MIERHPVTSSSLQSVGYDERTQEMSVEFKSGRVYTYKGVPAHTYRNMLRAPSIGRFHANQVKDVYPFTTASR